jgi:DUF4097 and DUF4098 domain-containing protein YvlB
MSQAKLTILEMLREGKITTEEAMEMLKEVEAEEGPPTEDRQERQGPQSREAGETGTAQGGFVLDFGWINDLRDAVEESARSLFPDGWLRGFTPERYTASVPMGDGECSLVFEGKNAPVKLETYEGDQLAVEAYYRGKSQWEPRFSLARENGIVSLHYDDNALRSLEINVRVPRGGQYGTVLLKTKNGPVTLRDMEARKIELYTKNTPIHVSRVRGEIINCETTNSPIDLSDVNVQTLDAHSTNSSISLAGVEALRASLVTSNSQIDVNHSDIVQIYARTSNSPLKFERLGYRKEGRDHSIDATTTNGKITLRVPEWDVKCKLRASTTNSGVVAELDDLEYRVKEKSYVEAQSRGYDEAACKLNLNLQTTNMKIHLQK